jgi:hypothetical protein
MLINRGGFDGFFLPVLIYLMTVMSVFVSLFNFSFLIYAIIFSILGLVAYIKFLFLNYLSLFFIGIVTLFLFGSFSHLFLYDYDGLFKLSAILNSILLGYIFSLVYERLPFSKIYYTLGILIFLYILFFPDVGGGSIHVNRTYYTVPLAIVLLASAIQEYCSMGTIDVKKILLYFFISTLSFSRAGLLLLPIFLLFYLPSVKGLYKKILLSLITISTIFLLIIIFPEVFELIVNKKFAPTDSGRLFIWSYYIEQVKGVKELFFGINMVQFNNDISYDIFNGNLGNTLHNSLLGAHSLLGMTSLIIFFIFFRLCVKVQKKNNFHSLYLFTLFLFTLKINTEAAILPQRFDYIFFAMLFYLYRYNRS